MNIQSGWCWKKEYITWKFAKIMGIKDVLCKGLRRFFFNKILNSNDFVKFKF